MSLKIMFQKIRKKGFLHYLKIILKKISVVIFPKYNKLFVFEIILSEYKPVKDKDNVNIKIAKDIDEIMPFILKRENWYLNHTKKLFERGNLCFIGEIDNQIASCLWTSFNEVYLSDVNYLLKVDKNIVPLIDGYTLHQYRGLGIYKAVWNYCLKYLRDKKKFEKVYGFIVPLNKRSLKSHKKLQLENVIMIITYLRIFGIKFHYIKKIKKED